MQINISKRFLSKHQRLAVFIFYKGKCAICKTSLDETNFETDHVVPYSIKKITNPALMQATCRPCNRKKGSTYNG